MAGSTIVSRTTVSEGNREKWTLSVWVKWSIETGSSYNRIYDAGGDTDYIRFNESDGSISWYTGIYYKTTNRQFRDPGAWYHMVFRYDSTAASGLAAANRMRMYVNGVEETSLAASSNPPEAFETATNNTGVDMVFGGATVSDQNLMGVLSHAHMCDGESYGPDTFGSTDSTSGIWKIIPSPSVTYGTNGFFLKFEDRDNLDLDSGTNTFTFTTSGNLTATYDNPSNNFCTLNILDDYYFGGTFSNGNTTVATGGGKSFGTSTMWLSSGLWYFEAKDIVSVTSDVIGITSTLSASGTQYGSQAGNYALYSYDGKIYTGGVSSSYGVTWGATDIIGCYIDLDANKLYFAKNGSIMNSGTGFDITAVASTENGGYTTVLADDHSVSSVTWSANFGNGYFGTTAVTSAVADEGGIGAFEYDPSDGGASSFDGSAKDFRAICTKNIKLYGG